MRNPGRSSPKPFPPHSRLALKHTCDISLFRRELPIFCLFLRKSPYKNFQNFLYILYISLFGISDLPTKIQEFPSLFNHSPYLGKKISLFVFWGVSHVCPQDVSPLVVSPLVVLPPLVVSPPSRFTPIVTGIF